MKGGYIPLPWHPCLFDHRLVLPKACKLPLTCPRVGWMGGGGAKGSGGSEASGGQGGCTGAVVGTPWVN